MMLLVADGALPFARTLRALAAVRRFFAPRTALVSSTYAAPTSRSLRSPQPFRDYRPKASAVTPRNCVRSRRSKVSHGELAGTSANGDPQRTRYPSDRMKACVRHSGAEHRRISHRSGRSRPGQKRGESRLTTPPHQRCERAASAQKCLRSARQSGAVLPAGHRLQ